MNEKMLKVTDGEAVKVVFKAWWLEAKKGAKIDEDMKNVLRSLAEKGAFSPTDGTPCTVKGVRTELNDFIDSWLQNIMGAETFKSIKARLPNGSINPQYNRIAGLRRVGFDAVSQVLKIAKFAPMVEAGEAVANVPPEVVKENAARDGLKIAARMESAYGLDNAIEALKIALAHLEAEKAELADEKAA